MQDDNNEYVIKNTKTGLYYVDGEGFVATSEAEADLFYCLDEADEVIDAAAGFGIDAELVDVTDEETEGDANIKQNADGTSFAVSFIRPKDLNADGSINSHKLNPSKRRFATKAEAQHHGARFATTQNHLGYYVTTRSEPVNAYVNKVTGLTNPEIGKKRVGGVDA